MTDIQPGVSAAATTITRRASLCVLTYKRPEGLRRALAALAALRVPAGWDLDVVVVDNDPAGSARAVVDRASSDALTLRYVVEERRGIPLARNRAVAEAATAEWLLFLDDDEAPRPDWLEQIDAVQRATDADVTVGASLPAFEQTPPSWIVRGGFFERRAEVPVRWRNAGPEIPYWYARTSGVLIRTTAFASLGPRPFDDRLALTGGEDHAFFEAVASAGGRIVWAADAIVDEWVPASRSTLRWLLRRSFRIGTTRSAMLLRQRVGAGRRVRRLVLACRDVALGLTTATVAPRVPARVRGLQRVACGLGLGYGALGRRYEEYRTTHGD